MNTEQRDTEGRDQEFGPNWKQYFPYEQRDVEAYWKSKQGRCLACGLEIAVQDQYCKSCEDFLLEMYAQQEANHLRIEMES